jgi:subfamily B ATP-binding cassette protein MsbA
LSFTSFEALAGVRTVQAFTLEPFQQARFAAASEAHERAMRRSYFIRGFRSPVMEVLGAAGAAVLIAFMVRSVEQHTLDPAHVASFAAAVLLMYDPVKKLGNVGDWLAQGEAALDRMQELMHAPIAITSGRAAAPSGGDLRIENVSFAYEDKPVLSDLSLHVEAGTVCALVGRSGAGKSTLMQLVLRFYDPTAGRILLGGLDLREWPLRDLRRAMAWVSQDIFLFNASVRDNLAAGESYTDMQIEAALDAAFALEFARELPRGLATVVGERGVTLSGGQRQRIAIARAFLRNAPLLLLDEATSALDTQSERMVQAALDRLMVNRTTLVIAHRLSTIERAAQIAVMDSGRIAQLGTHAELLARPGEYRALAGET